MNRLDSRTAPKIVMRTLHAAATCAMLAGLSGCGALSRNDNAEGVKLYQQGNYLGAVSHFQEALARQPGNADCFYNLGATYHQQSKLFQRPSDLQTAEQYYHLCLARNPDHAACQRALAVLQVEQKKNDDAMAQLEAWAKRQPMDPTPRVELARLCEEQGDAEMAEKHLAEALAIAPSNPRALVALGRLRETAGDSSQALADYSRALMIDPKQPTVAARVAMLNADLSTSRTVSLPVSSGAAGAVAGAQAPSQPPAAYGTVAR